MAGGGEKAGLADRRLFRFAAAQVQLALERLLHRDVRPRAHAAHDGAA